LWGLEHQLALPPETPTDPGAMSDAERASSGIVALGGDLDPTLDRLATSERLRAILGGELVDAITAVRRYEVDLLRATDPIELAERLRFAWTC
jgi:glutamine synthetase